MLLPRGSCEQLALRLSVCHVLISHISIVPTEALNDCISLVSALFYAVNDDLVDLRKLLLHPKLPQVSLAL
jgi:hypothetical protein